MARKVPDSHRVLHRISTEAFPYVNIAGLLLRSLGLSVFPAIIDRRQVHGTNRNKVIRIWQLCRKRRFVSSYPCPLELLALDGLVFDANQHIGLTIMAFDHGH